MQSHSLETLCIYSQHLKRKKVLLVSLSKNGNKGHGFQVNMLSFPATQSYGSADF